MEYNKIKEILLYGIVGVGTTMINYLIYYGTLRLQLHYIVANSIAWVGAVVFAFYMNKRYVFKSQNDQKKEAVAFFYLRLITLLLENVGLFLFIHILGVHVLFAKIIVSVVTVVGNYGCCKWKIFNPKEGLRYE